MNSFLKKIIFGAFIFTSLFFLTSLNKASASSCALGDVNGNGIIEKVDADMANQAFAGIITLTPNQILRADVDGDGHVTSTDALLIFRSVGKTCTLFCSLGDIDGNGIIDTVDATMVSQYFALLIDLTPDQKIRADVNIDGKINATDSLAISKNLGATCTLLGTLTSTLPSCVISTGNSSCPVTLSWTTKNPVGISAVTSPYPSPNTHVSVPDANSGSVSVSIPYGSRSFYLYNYGYSLVPSSEGTGLTITASCDVGDTWDSVLNKCIPNFCEQELATYASAKEHASCTSADDLIKYKTYSDLASTKYGVNNPTYKDYINLVNQSYNSSGIDCTNYFKTSFTLPGIPGDVEGAGCIKIDPIVADEISRGFVKLTSIPTVMGDINLDCKSNPIDSLQIQKMYNKLVPITICNRSVSATISATDCTIASGASTCNSTINWSSQNTNTSDPFALTSNQPNPNTTISTNISGSKSVAVNYGQTGFFIYDQASLLTQAYNNASCAVGTVWNGTICTTSGGGVCTSNGCEINTCTTSTCNNGCANVSGTKICSGSCTSNGCEARTCTTSTCNNGCANVSGTKICSGSCTSNGCEARTCTSTTCDNGCGVPVSGTKVCPHYIEN